MRWAAGLAAGIGLSLAAGAALACAPRTACGDGRQLYESHDQRSDAYESFDRREYGGEAYGGPPAYYDEPYGEGEPHAGPPEADEPPYAPHPGYGPDGYGQGYGAYGYAEGAWRKPDRGWYIHGHRAAPCAGACRPCDCLGRVSLDDSFFADAGGVGPIPIDGGYGGGFVIVDGGGSALGGASAHSSANVSVKFRGGFNGGHHGGKRHFGGGQKGH